MAEPKEQRDSAPAYTAPYPDGGAQMIETVYHMRPQDEWDDGWRHCGEVNANAALIAAAPKLLEACKAAYDLIGGIHTQFPSRQRKVFSKLGRAIAKAEGGAE